MRKSPERIRDLFDRVAAPYDMLNHLLSCGCDIGWRKRMVSLANARPGEDAVDLCTGTGDAALIFASRGVRVTAVDFSNAMLACARRKADRRRMQGMITFVQADVCSPFTGERFRAASMAFGLRNLADRRLGLISMVRLLEAGGTAVVLEFSPRVARPLQPLYDFYLQRCVPLLGGLFTRTGAYRWLSSSIRDFMGPEEVCAAMREAGLYAVEAYPLCYGVAYLYKGVKR